MPILIKTIATIIISGLVTLGVFKYAPLSWLETTPNRILGSTITTILSTDRLSDSRAVINTNFSNLNTDKIEATVTTLNSLTSASALATVGTITSGTWNGTTIAVANGGTGSTTLSQFNVLLGSSTNAIGIVSGLGTTGQFLTSGGAGTPPTWTTSAIDQAGTYNWTGAHTFNGSTTTISNLFISASTTGRISRLLGISGANLAITTASTTVLSFSVPENVLFVGNMNGVVESTVDLPNWTVAQTDAFYIEFKQGANSLYTMIATTTKGYPENPGPFSGKIVWNMYGDAGTAVQKHTISVVLGSTDARQNLATTTYFTSAFDSTVAQPMMMIIRVKNGSGIVSAVKAFLQR